MYQRKTTDEIVIQGNYGYGWDDLTTEASMPEARKTLRVYQKMNKMRHTASSQDESRRRLANVYERESVRRP